MQDDWPIASCKDMARSSRLDLAERRWLRSGRNSALSRYGCRAAGRRLRSARKLQMVAVHKAVTDSNREVQRTREPRELNSAGNGVTLYGLGDKSLEPGKRQKSHSSLRPHPHSNKSSLPVLLSERSDANARHFVFELDRSAANKLARGRVHFEVRHVTSRRRHHELCGRTHSKQRLRALRWRPLIDDTGASAVNQYCTFFHHLHESVATDVASKQRACFFIQSGNRNLTELVVRKRVHRADRGVARKQLRHLFVLLVLLQGKQLLDSFSLRGADFRD
mmetsp:Transcript_2469/g.5531  ORF Transcript_2469/g.5531 Transcript_2469/m.5531 type:complete len:278 (+) Transcript_2469:1370-2203(+)